MEEIKKFLKVVVKIIEENKDATSTQKKELIKKELNRRIKNDS